MQKTFPCIWFNGNAQQAAQFYKSVFKNTKIGTTTYYGPAMHLPKGTVLTITLFIEGREFMLLNAGAEFKPNPSISFFINCKTAKEVKDYYAKLSPGGTVLMALAKYPFSDLYAWVADKYGVSWQIMLAPKIKRKIVPSLLFTGNNVARAEEALAFYKKTFKNMKIIQTAKYPQGQAPDGALLFSRFTLEGNDMSLMSGVGNHQFTFSEGVSIVVTCKDQKEIDYFWETLSTGGEKSVCGWLKDKFGVSWQINHPDFDKMAKNPAGFDKAMQAVLTMTKLDMQAIKDAYNSVKPQKKTAKKPAKKKAVKKKK